MIDDNVEQSSKIPQQFSDSWHQYEKCGLLEKPHGKYGS